MILIQLDVKRGNVNDIVNDSIRSSYQVRQANVHVGGRTLLLNVSVAACNMRRTSDRLLRQMYRCTSLMLAFPGVMMCAHPVGF